MGGGEDLAALATIADGAAIERLLDPIVGEPAALRDGGGEVRMAAAPVLISGDLDLEEIGDIGRERAESAELAGLGGIDWVVGSGRWTGGGRRVRGGRCGGFGARKFPVIGGIRGHFYFFGAFRGRFYAFFPFRINLLWINSLIFRNREFDGAEQGIGFAGTGNSWRAIAGVTGDVRSRQPGALGHAQGGA